MRERREQMRSERRGGFATVAVLLFIMLAGIVFAAEMFLGLAQYEATRSLDRYHQLRVEKAAISNIVAESIYETWGTRLTRETGGLAASIQAKLDAFAGPDVSYGSSAGGGTPITVSGLYAGRSADGTRAAGRGPVTW